MLILIHLCLFLEVIALERRIIDNHSPTRGAILGECRGRTINWCCQLYLWGQWWYPYSYDRTRGEAWNYAVLSMHERMAVEGVVTYRDEQGNYRPGDPVDMDRGTVGFGCLSTVTRRTLERNHYTRFTGFLWYYACQPGQELERFVTYAKYNAKQPIAKARCRATLESVKRQLIRVRDAAQNRCLQFTVKVSNAALQLKLKSTQQRHRQVNPDPDTTATDLDARYEATSLTSPLLSIQDLDLSEEKRKLKMVQKAQADDLRVYTPMIGHTYLACAAPNPHYDILMEVSMLPDEVEARK